MITREHYNTAEEAFNSLNIGEKFDKRHAARRCKAVEKALNHGCWSKYATAGEYTTIFRNGSMGIVMPFNKSVKMGQVNGSDDIVVFSDQYNVAEAHLAHLCQELDAKGVIIQPFATTYNARRIDAEKWWINLKKIKMICDGYEYLYRGMLVGFVITTTGV